MTTNAERNEVYKSALLKWGAKSQMIVAIEELSELQKELCKYMRGNMNEAQIAEETADVFIMLEQLVLIFGNGKEVTDNIAAKVERLKGRVEKW